MKTPFWKNVSLITAAMSLSLLLAACGGGGSSGSPALLAATPSGTVSLDVTDAPSMDFAHVYVTIKGVAFHTLDTAGDLSPGWHAVNLPAPVTVDLAQLANGRMYTDVAGSPLFNGMSVPARSYRQIRIFLAASEDPYVGSITGLTYNNEVQLPGDATHYVLRIPTAHEGIRLIPESPVVVTAGGNVRLALDFNLNNDVVEVTPNGSREFILKPRLGYFDMNSVGAVTGTVSFGNLSSSRFVIKAEQVKSGANYRIVRRWTTIDRTTGRFNLYPLPVFGNATTASYDILLRGLKAQTAIIKGVTVHRGTSLARSAVDLGSVTIQPGTDFTAQISSPVHPSGSWVNFYQTIAGDPVAYEVRFRHISPYSGLLWKPIDLSNSPIQVASFNNATGTVGPFTGDSTSQGSFSAVADALFYARGAAATVANGPSPVMFTPGTPTALPNANAIRTTITIPSTLTGLTNGHLFITHGGMIIDSYDISSLIATNGGQISVANLPGGTAASPVAGAYYGVMALGWGSGKLGFGFQLFNNLTAGDATAAITMR
jgi:hypothetical protein